MNRNFTVWGFNLDFLVIIPICTCIGSNLLIQSVVYIYESRMNNKKLKLKPHMTKFFISKLLFISTITLLGSTIAITLDESAKGHYVNASLFFLILPISLFSDLYVYEYIIYPKLQEKYHCKDICKYLKRSTFLISLISLSVMFNSVQLFPVVIIKDRAFFLLGEVIMFGSFIPLGVSMSYDLFLTKYYLI